MPSTFPILARHTPCTKAFVILLLLFGNGIKGQKVEASENGSKQEFSIPVKISSKDGSILHAWLPSDLNINFTTNSGTKSQFSFSKIQQLTFGEQIDPDASKRAQKAVKDLESDNYQERQHALKTLKEMGNLAIPALQEAKNSQDPEIATQAKQLLGEMAAGVIDMSDDLLVLTDNIKHSGSVLSAHIKAFTHYGLIQFPVSLLQDIQKMPKQDPTIKTNFPKATIKSPPLITLPPPAPHPIERTIQRFSIMNNNENGPLPPQVSDLFPRLANMQRPSFETHDGKELKAGAQLETLYSSQGLVLRSSKKNQTIVAVANPLDSLTKQFSAAVDTPSGQGDIEFHFIQPNSLDPKTGNGVTGGVLQICCFIGNAPANHIGMDAFDRFGHRIARIYNTGESELTPLGPGMETMDEIIGFRSKTPITRIRLFRAPNALTTKLYIDDIMFSEVIGVDRAPWLSAAGLVNGDIVTGRLIPKAQGTPLLLQPEFLGSHSQPITLNAKNLSWLEPALVAPHASSKAVGQKWGPYHSILLQDGESFRACILTLDKTTVTLGLAGQAKLVLPRAVLRKIDLWPDRMQPGEIKKKLAVEKEEKDGVAFKQPKQSKPKKDEKPAKESPTKGLPRMDGAEILKIDWKEQSLVVDPKDGGGAWPIDLLTAHYLIFPKAAKTIQTKDESNSWEVLLRQGSRFEVQMKSVHATAVVVTFAGGTVSLPFSAIKRLSKKK